MWVCRHKWWSGGKLLPARIQTQGTAGHCARVGRLWNTLLSFGNICLTRKVKNGNKQPPPGCRPFWGMGEYCGLRWTLIFCACLFKKKERKKKSQMFINDETLWFQRCLTPTRVFMKPLVNLFSSVNCHAATLVEGEHQPSSACAAGCSWSCEITAYSSPVAQSRGAIIRSNDTQ